MKNSLQNTTVGIGVPKEVYSIANLSGEKIYQCYFDDDSHKDYSRFYPIWKGSGRIATTTTFSAAGNLYAKYDEITPYTVMTELLASIKTIPIRLFMSVTFPRSHFHEMVSGKRAIPTSFWNERSTNIDMSAKLPTGYSTQRVVGLFAPRDLHLKHGDFLGASIELQDSTRGVRRSGRDAIILSNRLIDFLQLKSTPGVAVIKIENSQYSLLRFDTQFTTMSGERMRINAAKNNVLRNSVKQAPVINTFERVAGTQNVSLAIDKRWEIRLKDENDVEKLSGHQFTIRQDELQRWRDTKEHLLTLKMDEVDVFIPELKVANVELSAVQQQQQQQNLQKSGKARMTLERNKLVDCIAIPREEEFFVFNGNRRSFKPIYPERGISQLTVELRSTGDKDKSPWFHTGATLVEIELRRNWSLHREERE